MFGVDLLTNAADYGFHIYLGRSLPPGDFAVVQTVNAALLVVVTTFAVMQPVVARYAAESAAESGQARALFQRYFRQSALLGVGLTAVVWMGRRSLAIALNVPVTAVTLTAAMLLLSVLRPVVAGMLQGRQQFVAFGLTRAAYALGRLALALVLIGLLGGGVLAGVATMPLAALVAFTIGLALLGQSVWQRVPAPPRRVVWAGWRLSLAAFAAYAAYMSLLSYDLIWVNGHLTADLAGSYATAVVLRRVLAVLPGAVIVIFYPRVVAGIAQGRLPDRLLAQTAAVVLGANLLLTAVYFAFGPALVRLLFGPAYADAPAILGWMGLAMTGYGVAAVWLNLFLATRPWPFVVLLAGTAALQGWLLARIPGTLWHVTAVFTLCGWVLVVGGFCLYASWLRPALRAR